MKKIIVIASFLTLLAGFSTAQNTDYNVVFDFTSKDTLNQQSLIREIADRQDRVAAARGRGIDLGQDARRPQPGA